MSETVTTLQQIHDRSCRLIACERALEDPAGRKIATENIAEGLFWRMYDVLREITAEYEINHDGFGDLDCLEKSEALLSTLNVQEPENG